MYGTGVLGKATGAAGGVLVYTGGETTGWVIAGMVLVLAGLLFMRGARLARH